MIPLRLGSEDDFARVRGLLGDAGYTTETIARRFGIVALHQFRAIWQGREAEPVQTPLDLLVRLFLDGEMVDNRRAGELLPAGSMEVLSHLGLIQAEGERAWSTVLLYPIEWLWIVSDRESNPDGRPHHPADDVVYPAATANTFRFLSGLPQSPCDAFLDLCAGSGVAALLAGGRYARHAWAFDITERSTRFAEFNRRLNGLDNVTVGKGDLYEPAGDLTFDRIVAHPPYVPAAQSQFVFRDGGADGEQITRRIIEGAPPRLRPGGSMYLKAMVTDRTEASCDARIRTWLGDQAPEFDLFLAALDLSSPEEFLAFTIRSGKSSLERVSGWRRMLNELGVTTLFQGFILIRRKSEPRPPITVRRMLERVHPGRALEWLLRWETAAAQPDFAARLLESRPRTSDRFRLDVEHRKVEGQLVPSAYTLRADSPFAARCSGAPWMAMLAAQADGTLTAREHMARLQERGLLPRDAPAEEFAEALRTLVAAALLEIDEFSLPPAEG